MNKTLLLKRIASVTALLAVMFAAMAVASVADSNMQVSNGGLDLIKTHEGCRLTAYKALESEKYYTIGWGHYGADVKANQKITQAEADNLLKRDIKEYEGYVNKFANKHNRKFTQNQFDALVSFTYNNGPGWTTNSNYNIYKYLSSGKYTANEISDTFTSWCHAGGQVINGLLYRRQAEAALFLTPASAKYEIWEVTANPELNLRSSATTSSGSLGYIQKSARIIITEKKNAGGYTWGKTRYYLNGKSVEGWCALTYAKHVSGSLNAAVTTAKPTTTTKPTTTKPTTTKPTTTREPLPNAGYGDANDDGYIDAKDVMLLRKYIAKWQVTVHASADCNADGRIDAKDVMLLRKYIARWNVVLGPQPTTALQVKTDVETPDSASLTSNTTAAFATTESTASGASTTAPQPTASVTNNN